MALMEVVAGFGLGGSAIAMFGRVGGGIYTKAADVGADLAGKVVEDLPEDDPHNPGTIADNVGDNGGGEAGLEPCSVRAESTRRADSAHRVRRSRVRARVSAQSATWRAWAPTSSDHLARRRARRCSSARRAKRSSRRAGRRSCSRSSSRARASSCACSREPLQRSNIRPADSRLRGC